MITTTVYRQLWPIPFILLLLTQAINAQQDDYKRKFKDVQPTRCDKVYLRRTTQFRQSNKTVKPGGVVLLGDSITQAFPQQNCPKEWNLNARGISGDGIGGSTFRGLINRLNISCHDLKPSVVFIKIGINDIIQWNPTPPQSPEKLRLETMREVIQNIKNNNPGVSIYITSVLPTRKRDNSRGAKLKFESYNPTIINYNNKLQALAKETKCSYFDLHSKFYDTQKKELKATYTKDGVHLTKAGYDLWITELKKIIPKK